jgi:hypothetical protein
VSVSTSLGTSPSDRSRSLLGSLLGRPEHAGWFLQPSSHLVNMLAADSTSVSLVTREARPKASQIADRGSPVDGEQAFYRCRRRLESTCGDYTHPGRAYRHQRRTQAEAGLPRTYSTTSTRHRSKSQPRFSPVAARCRCCDEVSGSRHHRQRLRRQSPSPEREVQNLGEPDPPKSAAFPPSRHRIGCSRHPRPRQLHGGEPSDSAEAGRAHAIGPLRGDPGSLRTCHNPGQGTLGT